MGSRQAALSTCIGCSITLLLGKTRQVDPQPQAPQADPWHSTSHEDVSVRAPAQDVVMWGKPAAILFILSIFAAFPRPFKVTCSELVILNSSQDKSLEIRVQPSITLLTTCSTTSQVAGWHLPKMPKGSLAPWYPQCQNQEKGHTRFESQILNLIHRYPKLPWFLYISEPKRWNYSKTSIIWKSKSWQELVQDFCTR